MPDLTRRRLLLAGPVAGLVVAGAAGCAKTPAVHGEHGLTEDTAGLTPAQALAKLKDGNNRFVAMTEVEPNVNATRLMAVSKGQKPFVGVLGCVDSRVPPELVFDRGLGDLFDARVAGAIAVDAAVGSLEFGVEEFGVPLLVVLGHSRCGAVTAAVKATTSGGAPPPGQISAVVDPILPAVAVTRARGVPADALVDAAAREVVRRGVERLRTSPVLAERLRTGALDVIGAFYDLDTGRVEFLSPLP